MPDDPTQTLTDRLSSLERDLERLTTGIALLGIKPCSACKKFFRISEPGVLFDAGIPVCYGCIPDWWPQMSADLSTKRREIIEFELKNWLIHYHHAEVFRSPEKLPKDPPPRLQLVVSCHECNASGALDGTRCRFCDGRGTLWIAVRQ